MNPAQRTSENGFFRPSIRRATALVGLEQQLTRIASGHFRSCGIVFLLAILIRLAILPISPKPEPKVMDEFSYILAGETFAMGRMTNPSHPLWRYFDTYHINLRPTYQSKYPPAQGVFLALGIRLAGHPWYGVLLSSALMCACLCWMLQGWMPARFALLGGLLAVLQFAVGHYWTDSYWGGAIPAAAGALVIGALPRLARGGGFGPACALASGIAILMHSRPYEGFVLTALGFVALLWLARSRVSTLLRPAVVAPVVIILGCAGAAMALYNLRVTGSATTMPYVVNAQQYGGAPIFWILPAKPAAPVEYRDPGMRELWQEWDRKFYETARRNPIKVIYRLVFGAMPFVFSARLGLIMVLLFGLGLTAISVPRLRLVSVLLAAFLAAILLERATMAHYLAPGVGLFLIVAVTGLRLLRTQEIAGRRSGPAAVAAVLIVGTMLTLYDGPYTKFFNSRVTQPPPTPLDFRKQVLAKLKSDPGSHLVMVRYSPDHDVHKEIVYNGPEIDSQKVIFAFDYGPEKNGPLFDYFRGRTVWLMQPDGPTLALERYPGT
jgi:hypothetical protein